MRSIVVMVALFACGKSNQGAPPSGSSGHEPAPPPVDAAPPKPKQATSEDRAKQYDTCWSYFNAGKTDEFKHCFTDDGINDVPGMGEAKPDEIVANLKTLRAAFPDVKGTPELVLASGTTVVGIALLTGKQTGPYPGVNGVTNNKIGIRMGAVIETDDTVRAKRESDYFDEAEMMGQLAPDAKHPGRPALDKPMDEVVAIAKGDDKEKANLDTFTRMNDAFTKHDVKALGDLLADDLVWSEEAEPKDQSKQEMLAGSQQAWKMMHDLKLVPHETIAAGDYVAVVESFEGTNDAPIPDMGLTKPTGKKIAVPVLSIFKIEAGKVKRAWIFYQTDVMMRQLGLKPGPS